MKKEIISASVVLYNTSFSMIENVLKSYVPSVGRLLYLIDNSEQENAECKDLECDYITYIFNGKNVGYGGAHNIGMKRSIIDGAKYHIVLNPDVYFENSVIDELKQYADENEDVVYMLPKVLYPDGRLQYLCKLLPTPFDLIFRRFMPAVGPFKKMNDRYVLKESGYDKIMNPPCLSGCFMFMRVSTIKEHELFFDEKFFMYCEDFDLIRRMHRVGKTIFYPNVNIVHMHEKSSYKNLGMLMQHMKSACLYFNKYGWFFDKERRIMNRYL